MREKIVLFDKRVNLIPASIELKLTKSVEYHRGNQTLNQGSLPLPSAINEKEKVFSIEN